MAFECHWEKVSEALKASSSRLQTPKPEGATNNPATDPGAITKGLFCGLLGAFVAGENVRNISFFSFNEPNC